MAAQGLPGAPAAADPEGEAPGASQLPLSVLSPENTTRVQQCPEARASASPFPRAAPRKQLVSREAGDPALGPLPLAAAGHFPLALGVFSFNWEAGVQAWGGA